jgi:8-oxo-dGTP pyrophosphatase MutT (NUDIX family)
MLIGQIRVIALAIIRREDDILVLEGYDPSTGVTFYRPLGGGVEFGEYGDQTVARELREELGVELAHVRYLETLENVFTYDGKPGHEIIRLYTCDLADPGVYARGDMTGHEDDGTTFRAVWRSTAEFRAGGPPLYPDGLLNLLLATAPHGPSC